MLLFGERVHEEDRMKNSLAVRTITLLFSCFCLFPSLVEACDEFEKDFIIRKLFVIEIRNNVMEQDFSHMARRCGFDIESKRADLIGKTLRKDLQANMKSIISTQHSLNPIIQQTAARYNVDPALVQALIHVESSFARTAVSPKGAIGLMQVMPATAMELGVRPDDLWDASTNIDTGVRYLALNIQQFGSVKKALVAYNAGPRIAGQVMKPEDLTVIPQETKTYLKRVLSQYMSYKSSGFGK